LRLVPPRPSLHANTARALQPLRAGIAPQLISHVEVAVRRSWFILGLLAPISLGSAACEGAQEDEGQTQEQSMLEREAERARQHGEEQARRAEQRAEQLEQSAQQQQEAAEQQREAAEERAQALTAQEELRREQREAEQTRESARAELREQETQERQVPVQPLEERETETTTQQELQVQQQPEVQPEQQQAVAPPSPPAVTGAEQSAVAELESPSGEPVAGTVVLSQTQSGDGVALQATVAGLEAGRHQVSIADASACEGAQAAGQLPPPQQQQQQQQQQGSPSGQQPPPAGQQQAQLPIGEIEVGPEGTAQFRALLDQVELAQGSQDSVIGRAMLITDAAAGEPVACGIVESTRG
jgi:hypothetical protein